MLTVDYRVEVEDVLAATVGNEVEASSILAVGDIMIVLRLDKHAHNQYPWFPEIYWWN